MDRLQQVFNYIDSNFHIIPLHNPTVDGCSCTKGINCSSVGKHPRTQHGLKDATTDRKTVKHWLQLYSSCNIGIITGEKSGILVIDVDNKKDDAGSDSLEKMERYYGELPVTLKQHTGCGFHLLFRYPKGISIKNATSIGGYIGIDVRSDGGYIVAAPSIHANGRQYRWDSEFCLDGIAPLPEKWIQFLKQDKPNSKQIITTGDRNNSLFRKASAMWGKGKSETEIVNELLRFNREQVTPPLPEQEVLTITQGVCKRYPQGTQNLQPGTTEIAQYLEIIPDYIMEDGILKRVYDNKRIPMADFIPIPLEEIVYDDGRTRERYFCIKGLKENGGKTINLQQVLVKASNLIGMHWIADEWGFKANILPPIYTKKDYLRDIINRIGAQTAISRTIYTHTGWRKINNQYCFLYHKGAIGNRNVSVELQEKLSAYNMTSEICFQDSISAVLSLFKVSSDNIMYPLMAITFLSPLNEFLRKSGHEPAFLLFLLGRTQTKKSTIAAIMLSFFGRFTSSNLPSSFKDTENAIEKKCHALKDVLTVIDDFHPVTNYRERQNMEKTAQSLSRGYGDRTGKDRMQADTTIRQGYAPRGNAIITGEDFPDIGQSGSARNFIIELTPSDIPASEHLNTVQEAAEKGALVSFMCEYIKWLVPQADLLPGQLKTKFLQLRRKAINENIAGYGRTGDIISWLQIGMGTLIDFLAAQKVVTTSQAQKQKVNAWKIFCELSATQVEKSEEDKPSNLFIHALKELLESGKALVIQYPKNQSIDLIKRER